MYYSWQQDTNNYFLKKLKTKVKTVVIIIIHPTMFETRWPPKNSGKVNGPPIKEYPTTNDTKIPEIHEKNKSNF